MNKIFQNLRLALFFGLNRHFPMPWRLARNTSYLECQYLFCPLVKYPQSSLSNHPGLERDGPSLKECFLPVCKNKSIIGSTGFDCSLWDARLAELSVINLSATDRSNLYPLPISIYRTCTIITEACIFSTPFFSAVYNQERVRIACLR